MKPEEIKAFRKKLNEVEAMAGPAIIDLGGHLGTLVAHNDKTGLMIVHSLLETMFQRESGKMQELHGSKAILN